jgi:outer membrane protein OmpA-like peptidoglycan-associated protein
VSVVGHTDVIAGDPTNDPLSQERADAVAAALGAQLPGVQITTSARGQEEPVADNNTDQGRQLNRRAVITASA